MGITPILSFLNCPTPAQWVEHARHIDNQAVLLIDHANCEKKAAASALNLIYRYTTNFQLLNKMSRLAREELRHFEQVVRIMQQRGIEYRYLSASRYAEQLRQQAGKQEPYKVIDSLIIGAIIEARSCERFYALAPHLDQQLSEFYGSLFASEARHYQDYLKLANLVAKTHDLEIGSRVALFLSVDEQLINSTDSEFRFHSGIPK